MLKMPTKKTTLYACCVPVQGARRSVICDLQKQKMDFIPNALCELLTADSIFSIENIKKEIDSEYHSILNEYFDFLYANDYIFDLAEDELDSFPKLELDWLRPEEINNMIFDINAPILKNTDFKKIAEELDLLGCKAIQFRCFEFIELGSLNSLLEFFARSRVKHIDLILPYSTLYEANLILIEQLSEQHPRIQFVTFYNSPARCVKQSAYNKLPIIYTPNDASSHLYCGNINSDDFYPNLLLFTESQKHNTCLNRKISIDIEGYIRNCPSMKQHYGNIRDTSLQQALEHPDFKKYWNVHKDQIKVCKDCEFRYICTDCRAYVEDPQDRYSKPLKCGYNPYTCEWEEWSTNPLKQKAIDHYNLRPIL
jgi:SPASM domain peptide maturase of grasp-with-spasm system